MNRLDMAEFGSNSRYKHQNIRIGDLFCCKHIPDHSHQEELVNGIQSVASGMLSSVASSSSVNMVEEDVDSVDTLSHKKRCLEPHVPASGDPFGTFPVNNALQKDILEGCNVTWPKNANLDLSVVSFLFWI